MPTNATPETPICWWRLVQEYDAATTLLNFATSPPAPADPEVFLRPVPLLLAAGWEAFHIRCAKEATAFLAGFTPRPALLPKLLRKSVAYELRNDKHDLAPWQLSGDDWRSYLTARGEIEKLYMGSGKSHHVDEFYEKSIGLPKLSSHWKPPAGLKTSTPAARIDKFIKARDSVAHRGELDLSIQDCWHFYAIAVEQVIRTIQAVSQHLYPITGHRFNEASMNYLRRTTSSVS